jgi:parallel beta-helix repeat protein
MKCQAASRVLLLVLVAGSLARFSIAAIFTVINTNDSGPGSLRQAILGANANSGLDTIAFSIGSGPQTIAPLSPLPTITDPVIVDGTTQPGYAGAPLIELSGANAGSGTDGLSITAGNSEVHALVINRFQASFLGGGGNGIFISGGGFNFVTRCYLGTNAAGTAILSNSGDGVLISSSRSNAIGFSSWGNLISGNGNGVGIIGTGSDENSIQGNTIGADVARTTALPNFSNGIAIFAGSGALIGAASNGQQNWIAGNQKDGVLVSGAATGTRIFTNFIGIRVAPIPFGNAGNGIQVSGASGTTVGGNDVFGNGANGVLMISGATGTVLYGNQVTNNALNGVIASGANGNTIGGGNVISSNGTNGVRIRSGASGNVVIGNLIGTDLLGVSAAGNALEGIQLNDGATGNTIGGSGLGQANVICGNGSNGVLILDPATTNNVVKGNLIGITNGGAFLPNAKRGVSIESGTSGNKIGGVAPGEGNTIAFHSGAGVFVDSGTGNAIRGNSIFRNGALGIDLAPAGVTANDHCDSDSGPNGLQNFPALLSASSLAGTTTITGSLDSTPSSSFTVDFYANTECDPSGFGQGRAYIGSSQPVMTDGSCAATFQASFPTSSPVQFVAATATDSAGNTSEFSACIPVPAAFYSVTPCRLIDTRGATGPYGAPALNANTDRSFIIGGQCGVPPTAKAVAVNVTVTQPQALGDLRLYPGGSTLPNTSTINYRAGQTRANNAVVNLGLQSDLTVRCVQGNGTVHFILDVTGYFE